jgi:UDP-glucose 4-epimerase
MVGGLLGVAPDVRFGPPRLGEIRHSVGDPARGRAALGLGDALPLRDGLRDLLGV